MKNLLKRIFGSPSSKKGPRQKGKVVRFDMDEMGPNADDEFKNLVGEIGDFTFFEGQVEHGYSKSHVSGTHQCPRCQAPTRQHYAQWIYATQIAPRVMLAPAGYFCTHCPTVIVDEAMIRLGIKKQFRYLGVVGLDRGKDADFFRTWNGQDAIYILDEDGNSQGISTLGDLSLPRSTSPKRKRKSRNRPPKRVKKKSRRRKK